VSTNTLTLNSDTNGVGPNTYGLFKCSLGWLNSTSVWNGWTFHGTSLGTLGTAGKTAIISSCTSATACTFTTTPTALSNASWWVAFPTPLATDTGAGEGIQVSAKAEDITLAEDDVSNTADEGLVCGEMNCIVENNTVTNPAQACSAGGCGCIIDSVQSTTTGGGISGLTATGNVCKADSSFGYPATAQVNISNTTGAIGYAWFLSVASPVSTSCYMRSLNFAGHSAIQGPATGTITNGFQAINSTASVPCVLDPFSVNIGPNVYDSRITNPLNIALTGGAWQGAFAGADIPTAFTTTTGTTSTVALTQGTYEVWGVYVQQAAPCNKILASVKTADTNNSYAIGIFTGISGLTATRLCYTAALSSATLAAGAIDVLTPTATTPLIPAGTRIYFVVAPPTTCTTSCALVFNGSAIGTAAGSQFGFLVPTATGVSSGTIPATLTMPADNPGYATYPTFGLR